MDIKELQEITKNIDSETTYTTCYKDIDNELVGKLYIDEKIYIDFDNSDIYCDSEPLGFSADDMLVIKHLINNPSGFLSPDALGKVRYGENEYYLYDCKQMARNLKTKLLKKIREAGNLQAGDTKNGIVQNKNKIGYKIELPKKIHKFTEIKKSDGYSAKDLFSSNYEETTSTEKVLQKSSVFSKKFLHSGALKLFDADGASLLNELSKLSDVFNYISFVDNNAATQTDIIKDLYNLVIDGCHNTSSKDILKIKGPLGSYKNRIMQYLYLAVTKNNEDILPFYMDIAFYERIAESDIEISENDIIEEINKDFDNIKSIVNGTQNKIPLLFLDGIRDFSRGNESLYSRIEKRISESDYKLVICLDADFTANKQHCFNIHPLGANDFTHFMRITSMDLYKKEDSIDFINNCIKISEYRFSENISAEKVYNNLIRLNFSDIDAYWLIYLLKTVFKYIVDPKSNIVDLYTAICMNILGDAKLLDSSAELAYEFEFESTFANNTNLNYDLRWRLIRKHRSILDFLIAKHYAKKLSSLDIAKEKTDENIRQLSVFNMVIQGHIARFAFEMLRGNEDYEYQIMKIAKNHYDELSPIGKSELTFRMTALGCQRRKLDCVRLIKKYLKKEKANYRDIPADNYEERKDSAFLLRSLFINLIYENDPEAFTEYFNLLLNDKEANSINRGFHLEYYGDKAYIPSKSLLDFEDDITKGKKSFNLLCLTLNERMRENGKTIYAAAIELITLCSLIQKRIEQSKNSNVFDVRPYIDNCLKYLKWITRQAPISNLSEVAMYFSWMYKELSELANEDADEKHPIIRYHHASPFNKFSIAKGVERSGWLKNEIPEPENIVEHMYNCWLIGMLYLPDEYHEYGYDKNSILQMLLIHDLVEAKTGNINRPERELHQQEFDNKENEAMQSLFLSGTYPNSVNLSTYRAYWNAWNKKEGINYYVAKDIDNIQTIYQFCHYYNQYPDKFTEYDICYWLSGIYRLESELGREISEKLIQNNPIYNNILEIFSKSSDCI